MGWGPASALESRLGNIIRRVFAEPRIDDTATLPKDVASALSEDVRGRLRASQVNAVVRVRMPLMIANAVNALAFALVLTLDGQTSLGAVCWVGAVIAVASVQFASAWTRRGKPPPEQTSDRTVRRLVRSAGLFGCLWAILGLVLLPPLSGFSLAFAFALLTGMIGGGALALYPVPAAALAFMVPITLGGMVGLIMSQGFLALGPALIALMFLAFFTAGVRRHSQLFVSDFLTRLELEKRTRLIEDLLEDTRLELVGSRRLHEAQFSKSGAIAAMGQWTGGVAHDFNNLLATIRGNAELLALQGQVDDALLGAIVDACDRGAAKTQMLLSIAQKQPLDPTTLSLPTLLWNLRAKLRPAFGPSYPIEIDIAEDTASPFADATHLETALTHLIRNAKDAMPEGGAIEIRCCNAKSADRSTGPVPGVSITVIDAGQGMSEATQLRATDPFFTTRTFGRGHGLGLASVAGFLGQSDGALSISSVPGEGTSVTMVLPSERSSNSSETPRTTRRILLVEEHPDLSERTESMLHDLGYEVHVAASPEEALDALAEGIAADLILTDIVSGGAMNGLDLISEARAHHPELAVVLMSAGNVGGRTKEAGLLYKPFSKAQLANHVRRALQVTA